MRSLLLLAAALILPLTTTAASARVPRACRACRAECGDEVSACIAALTPSCPQSPRRKAKRCLRKTKHLCRKSIKMCCVDACSASGTPVCCGTPSTTTTTLPGGGNPCFTDGGDGTIHDTCTRLQWEKKQ